MHGPGPEELAWRFLENGQAALVASDGHRATRAPHLDEAYAAAVARLGADAIRFFDGLRSASAGYRFHLAQFRKAPEGVHLDLADALACQRGGGRSPLASRLGFAQPVAEGKHLALAVGERGQSTEQRLAA